MLFPSFPLETAIHYRLLQVQIFQAGIGIYRSIPFIQGNNIPLMQTG
jgi:hypothetical protein